MTCFKSAVVEGFWGNHKISTTFHPDVNFIVGVNGSGKTTFIEILAAALRGSLADLGRMPFDHLKIELLGGDKGLNLLTLSIAKEKNSIHVNFRRDEDVLVDFEFETILGRNIRHIRMSDGRFLRKDLREESQKKLTQALAENLKVSWLSVLRHDGDNDDNEFENFETNSGVNGKLHEVKERLEKYFNEMTTQVEEKLKNLQKDVFLSLFKEPTSYQVPENVESYRKKFHSILKDFHIPDTENKIIDKYFDGITKGTAQSLKEEKIKTLPLTVFDWPKIRSIANDYEAYIQVSEEIISARTLFLAQINAFYQRKELHIRPNKTLGVVTESGKNLEVFNLSSGEKQLLILLGEALLQKNDDWIYIADEPELSMHVRWQLQLVSTLQKLNPKAQIVFATHSPEIMADYPLDRIIDMEKHITSS